MLAADRLVLPGVGAAGPAAVRLNANGLSGALNEAVRQRGRPMLGICLGMELLAERLLELESIAGSAGCRGRWSTCAGAGVARFPRAAHGLERGRASGSGGAFLPGARAHAHVLFCHSYTLVTSAAATIAARTTYDAPLIAAVFFGTVFATQFHPEKSQVNGQKLIRAFLDWRP